MRRPIPGVGPALEYLHDGMRTQRCSKCHAQRSESSLLLRDQPDRFRPIMVGEYLLGLLCDECTEAFYSHVQTAFPDRHAFPFVTERGELLPNPRCELGHALVYSPDGREMLCRICDDQNGSGSLGGRVP